MGGVSRECALENALAFYAANSSVDRHDSAETCVTATWGELRLSLEGEIERRQGRFSEVSSGSEKFEGPPWDIFLQSKLSVWTGVNGKQERSRSQRAGIRNLSREEVQTDTSRR